MFVCSMLLAYVSFFYRYVDLHVCVSKSKCLHKWVHSIIIVNMVTSTVYEALKTFICVNWCVRVLVHVCMHGIKYTCLCKGV